MLLQLLIGLGIGLLAVWLALVVFLLVSRQRGASAREALRLVPDTLRLLRRLSADRSLPRRLRLRLVLVIVYLVSPIDLIPDVIPVIGALDDAIVTLLVVRSVVRRAGVE